MDYVSCITTLFNFPERVHYAQEKGFKADSWLVHVFL